MSEPKFTPGPWHVFDNGLIFVQPPPDSGTLVIAGCGTSFIGDGGEQAQWQIDRNRANAALIAAAPEMYELLQKMYDWDELQTCRIPDVEEVLKKARGEE